MRYFDSTPDHVDLDDNEVFMLVLLRHFIDCFPVDILAKLRFSRSTLDEAIVSRRLSLEGMLAVAYFGYLPLWATYKGFQAQVKRLNKFNQDPEAEEFQVSAEKREKSAAAEYGFSRSSLKKLYPRLDQLARDHGFNTLRDVFRGEEDILADESENSPVDRIPYASGPRYLYDISKLVKQSGRADIVFETFDSWALVLFSEDANVFGFAVPPAALRVGDYVDNGYLNDDVFSAIWNTEEPIIEVPPKTLQALETLAKLRFPGHEFHQLAVTTDDVQVRWTMIHTLSKKGG